MLIQADAFHLPYPDKLFHACVTSPPYWGLRKYSGNQGEEPLGLEATPERHIERMVEVFREVRRVLRDDGVVWLNYGDCFASGSCGGGSPVDIRKDGRKTRDSDKVRGREDTRTKPAGDRQQGSLMLMPHRLAIALQDDGWIVRNDLVWFKRNPMPESVAGWRWERKRKEKARHKGQSKQAKDYVGSWEGPLSGGKDKVDWEYSDDYVLRKSSWRHTRAHEYVFMLCKSMQYYCNQEAVREGNQVYTRKAGGYKGHENPDGSKPYLGKGGFADDTVTTVGPNPRSVLDVPTQSYRGAHYATFPEKLIAPLIRASVPRRCCPECGMAWAAVVEKDFVGDNIDKRDDQPRHGIRGSGLSRPPAGAQYNGKVTDYRPTCECGAKDYQKGIVLDIFGGSGTTGMVAKQLLRRWVVMDISRPYLDEQAKVRTGSGTPSKALEGLPMFEETE